MLDIWAKHSEHHATCTVYGVWPVQCTPNPSHACHTVQVLPTLVFTAAIIAHSVYFEHFVGFVTHFQVPATPARASIMSIMGPVLASNFLLDC